MIDTRPIVAGKFAVGPQPRLEDLNALADEGFKTIISNRPDREAADQPGTGEMAAAAERLGLVYVHIPVRGPDEIGRADIEAFWAAVHQHPAPVLAHCGSGKRSFLLWAAGEVLHRGSTLEELTELGKAAGLDVSALPNLIERLQ